MSFPGFLAVAVPLAVLLLLGAPPTRAFLFEPDPCPDLAHCTCTGFTVACQGKGLDQLPAFVSTGISYRVLDLSSNNISSVQSGDLANVSTTRLDLSHNPLVTLDTDAFTGLEDTLEDVQLEDCGLTAVPDALSSLLRLKTLNLRHNPLLTVLPGSLLTSASITLETLDFSNTGIRSWPLALKASIRLKKLLASGNHLTSLPNDAFLSFAPTLQYLDLAYNALSAFPDAINDLRVVSHLDLSYNLFGTIPAGKFTYSKHSLRTLYLVHIMAREIPVGLKDLSALENLYLSYNPISTAQPEVFGGRIAQSLKVLHLDKTLLKSVPPALHYLTALTELNVTWNRFQYLENYAIDLPALQVLYLDKNPIVNVKFAAFSGLPALSKLYLRNTSLEYVPNAALAQVKQLTFIDMSFNKFKALYDYGFPAMNGLRELVLAGNPLANISQYAFEDLTGVTALDVQNCLLTGIPKAVQEMQSLRTVKVEGNVVNCTCADMGWVEVWRANTGLIAKVEGQCSDNGTMSIQNFIDNDVRSC